MNQDKNNINMHNTYEFNDNYKCNVPTQSCSDPRYHYVSPLTRYSVPAPAECSHHIPNHHPDPTKLVVPSKPVCTFTENCSPQKPVNCIPYSIDNHSYNLKGYNRYPPPLSHHPLYSAILTQPPENQIHANNHNHHYLTVPKSQTASVNPYFGPFAVSARGVGPSLTESVTSSGGSSSIHHNVGERHPGERNRLHNDMGSADETSQPNNPTMPNELILVTDAAEPVGNTKLLGPGDDFHNQPSSASAAPKSKIPLKESHDIIATSATPKSPSRVYSTKRKASEASEKEVKTRSQTNKQILPVGLQRRSNRARDPSNNVEAKSDSASTQRQIQIPNYDELGENMGTSSFRGSKESRPIDPAGAESHAVKTLLIRKRQRNRDSCLKYRHKRAREREQLMDELQGLKDMIKTLKETDKIRQLERIESSEREKGYKKRWVAWEPSDCYLLSDLSIILITFNIEYRVSKMI